MEYRRFERTYVVRLERGEEIVDSLTHLVEAEDIRLASVQGIGATDLVTVGVYDVDNKHYHKDQFSGAFEITALMGNITRMEGAPYLHLHITVADSSRNLVVGGHLNSARISATAEIFVNAYPGQVARRHDEAIGLNLFQFSD